MMRRRLAGGGAKPLSIFGNRELARVAVIGGVVLGAAALGGCSAVSDVFNRGPTVTVERTPGGDKPTVDVNTIKGNSSIAVLVNDQPITRYDIKQRAALMRVGGASGGEKAATDELIDETLKMYEAAKRGVSVPQGRVDAAYASIANNLKMTPQQLTQALAGQGIDSATLKDRLRAQMTWEQLVIRRTQAEALIKNADVTQALLAKGDPASMTTTEYTLQQIVFVVPSGSPNALYAQRRREAEAFRSRFTGCDNSLEQAKQLRGVVVKDIGRREFEPASGPAGRGHQEDAGRQGCPSHADRSGDRTDRGLRVARHPQLRHRAGRGPEPAALQAKRGDRQGISERTARSRHHRIPLRQDGAGQSAESVAARADHG